MLELYIIYEYMYCILYQTYSPIRGERPIPGRPTCAQHSALSGSMPSRVLDETATFISDTLPSVVILMRWVPSP